MVDFMYHFFYTIGLIKLFSVSLLPSALLVLFIILCVYIGKRA